MRALSRLFRQQKNGKSTKVKARSSISIQHQRVYNHEGTYIRSCDRKIDSADKATQINASIQYIF